MNQREFCEALASADPQLVALWTSHVQSNDGELFTYVYVDGVLGWTLEPANANSPSLDRVAGVLEAGLSDPDEQVQTLTVVGFLEQTPNDAPILRHLGPLATGWFREFRPTVRM